MMKLLKPLGMLRPVCLMNNPTNILLIKPEQIKRSVRGLAMLAVKFSPRFVAKTTGCGIMEALATCKREAALGHLEMVEVEGEFWFRLTDEGRTIYERQ